MYRESFRGGAISLNRFSKVAPLPTRTLSADREIVRRDYRAETPVFLSAGIFLGSVMTRTIDSTESPVSTAVELTTLIMRAFRYWAGTFK